MFIALSTLISGKEKYFNLFLSKGSKLRSKTLMFCEVFALTLTGKKVLIV